MDLEFISGSGRKGVEKVFGEGMMEIVLGVILNFVSGDLVCKQSVDAGTRGGRDSITSKVVSLCLRKSSKIPGQGPSAVSEKLLRIGFDILKCLALPPSSSRGTLAVSGIFPSCARMISSGLRNAGTNNTAPRLRKAGSFLVRAEGALSLFVNATLDGEGRKAVFGDWSLFKKLIDDLIAVERQLSMSLTRGLLLLIRNVCLDKNKSCVWSNKNWLNFILDSCVDDEKKIRAASLQCLHMLLYKSEKAVACVKEPENIKKILMAETLVVKEGRNETMNLLDPKGDSDLIIARSMQAVTSLMRN